MFLRGRCHEAIQRGDELRVVLPALEVVRVVVRGVDFDTESSRIFTP